MPLLPLTVAWTKAACVDTTVAKQCLGREAPSLCAPFEGQRKEALFTGKHWEEAGRRMPSLVLSLFPFFFLKICFKLC